jgi:hypothetical protein
VKGSHVKQYDRLQVKVDDNREFFFDGYRETRTMPEGRINKAFVLMIGQIPGSDKPSSFELSDVILYSTWIPRELFGASSINADPGPMPRK